MKKYVIIFIIIGISFILLGSGAVITGIIMANANQASLSDTETNQKIYIDDNFSEIEIFSPSANIKFQKSESETTEIIYKGDENQNLTSEVKNNKLTIKLNDDRKWYDYIFNINFRQNLLEISLPQNIYDKLNIDSTSGNINILPDFTFKNADIKMTSGDLKSDAILQNEVQIKNTSGTIEIFNIDCKNCTINSTSGKIIVSYGNSQNLTINNISGNIVLENANSDNINIKNTSGNINFYNVISTNNFTTNSISGNINFDKIDSKNISFEATSGNIIGSVLTAKNFSATATSGKISLPENSEVTDEKAQFSTHSGNIEIKLSETK